MDQRKYHNDEDQLLLCLPVFHLSGGSESERRWFVRKLVLALDNYQICVNVVRQGSPKRYHVVSLLRQFDLVLLDKPVDFPVRKICFEGGGDQHSDLSYRTVGDDSGMEFFIERLVVLLSEMVVQVPVWACVLIGGKSSRMGCPKHLLPYNTRGTGDIESNFEGGGQIGRLSWLEHTIDVIRPMVSGVVLSGRGDLPASCEHLVRVPDIDGVYGPLSGLLSATRWNPLVSWLVVACDMPQITNESINWLLSGRRPGSWGRVPRFAESEHCEPLFAIYDFRAAQLFEDQLIQNKMRVGEAASHLKVDNPIIPDHLRLAWQNINSPEQLKQIKTA